MLWFPPLGTCGGNQIKCEKGSDKGYCIDEKKKCDGVKNCYDGEDEWDCSKSAGRGGEEGKRGLVGAEGEGHGWGSIWD